MNEIKVTQIRRTGADRNEKPGDFMVKLVKLAAGTAILASMLTSVAAGAVTYTVDLDIGSGGVTGTIDTDGTFGVLATENITDWSLLLDDGSGTLLLDGTSNSAVGIFGTDVTATATGLFFDFSGFTAFLFQNPFVGSAVNYICFNPASGACSGNQSAIALRLSGTPIATFRTGVTQIGSAGAVPEPASWALLIAGFGLTGAAMRRRRVTITA